MSHGLSAIFFVISRNLSIFVCMKIEFYTKDRYVGRFFTVMDIVLSVIFTTALMWIMCIRGGMKVFPASLIIIVLDIILLALRIYDRERKGGMSHITSVIDERIEELERMKWDDPLNGDLYQDEIDMLKNSRDELNRDTEDDHGEKNDEEMNN